MAELTRREFLLIGAAGGAVVAVGVIIPLSRMANPGTAAAGASTTTTLGQPPPAAVVELFPRLRVASLSDVSTTEPVKFQYPLQGQHNVLVKLGSPVVSGMGPDQDIVAYSSICTHMGCVLEKYNSDWKALGPCPCHFSTFDLANDGMVTLGQATQNLPRVLLDVEGDDIYATGVVRLVYGFVNTLQGAPVVEVG